MAFSGSRLASLQTSRACGVRLRDHTRVYREIWAIVGVLR